MGIYETASSQPLDFPQIGVAIPLQEKDLIVGFRAKSAEHLETMYKDRSGGAIESSAGGQPAAKRQVTIWLCPAQKDCEV
jgi:hypothetical protein